MKQRYSFSVLRYVHDPVTEEFVNVGIAVCSPDARVLKAKFSRPQTRVSAMFGRIDHGSLGKTLRFIEDQINRLGNDLLQVDLPFSSYNLDDLLACILPPDDSSLRFYHGGGGISTDLDATIRDLHSRYIERYMPERDQLRDDQDVWKAFKQSFARKNVPTELLAPKVIVAPHFQHKFDLAWKNSIWHVMQPLSLDLKDKRNIEDKASHWLGRVIGLAPSSEQFKVHFLVGDPSNSEFKRSAENAKELLRGIPPQHAHVVEEADADRFADDLASAMHG